MLLGTQQTHARVLGYRSFVSVWRRPAGRGRGLGEQATALAAQGDSPDWQAGSAEIYPGFARYTAGEPAAGLEHTVGTPPAW